MEKNKVFVFVHLAIAIILLALSHLDQFHFLSLIALTPIILLLKDALLKKINFWQWPLTLALTLVTSYIISQLLQQQSIDLRIIFYVFGLAVITSLYWFIRNQLNSNFGLIIVIILWLAYDYATLALYPDLSVFFPFKQLGHSVVNSWTDSIGFMGLTLWALSSNFLLANVLYNPKSTFNIKIRSLSLLYSVIFLTSPIWILELWPNGNAGITYQTMVNYYKGLNISDVQYAQRGEWIGRTCAWISVLIVLYSFVKRKVKK